MAVLVLGVPVGVLCVRMELCVSSVLVDMRCLVRRRVNYVKMLWLAANVVLPILSAVTA